ncbi:SET [Glarea lozoyensis ATCC 20868]|uniref:SET n=1 Tax=Glarea lozoyensis (strain ATCC 20868 / MF5171) TaxID=1116229 RepID=S3CVN3_GLAL2|nr:SET [Glarea lozoyensis ATCC 20868]EPE29014.1 SET [Glarea lozoyensis ATCC 20868]
MADKPKRPYHRREPAVSLPSISPPERLLLPLTSKSKRFKGPISGPNGRQPLLFRISTFANHNCGQGLLANQAISAGSQIWEEKPIWTGPTAVLGMKPSKELEESLETSFKGVTKEEMKILREMGNNQEFVAVDEGFLDTPWLGLVKTNAIPLTHNTTSPHHNTLGIFLSYLSKLNHACKPNTLQTYDSSRDLLLLYAITDIAEDEELTISYIPDLRLSNPYLKKYFGFTCWCNNWCRYPESKGKKKAQERAVLVDRLWTKIHEDVVGDEKIELGTTMMLGRCLWGLLVDEGMDTDFRIARLFLDCMRLMGYVKDLVRFEDFALLAHKAYLSCTGPSAPEVERIKTEISVLSEKTLSDDQWKKYLKEKYTVLDGRFTEDPSDEVMDELFHRELWAEKYAKGGLEAEIDKLMGLDAGSVKEVVKVEVSDEEVRSEASNEEVMEEENLDEEVVEEENSDEEVRSETSDEEMVDESE